MKLNRKLVLVLALVLSVAMATTGTLAYLTDRDSKVNEFTMGNVSIDLEEAFEQGAELLPGVAVEKEPTIKNTGSTDAWVWMEVAVPENFKYNLTIKQELGNNWQQLGDVTVKEDKAILTFLYKDALKPGETTSALFKEVELNEWIDIKPDGAMYKVHNGEVTDLDWNINTDGNVKMYVSAYGIQAEGIDNVNKAYTTYNNQWGEDGGKEWAPSANNQAALDEALANGTSNITLSAGKYTLPALSNKTVTIVGGKDTVIDMANSPLNAAGVGTSGLDITFDGVTVKFSNTADYKGIQHSKKVVYKNCTITGKQFLYSDAEFINCTFENYDDYSVWTYGSNNATFENCTFLTGGKAILVYCESAAGATQNIAVKNCTFYDNGAMNTSKAAIEVHAYATTAPDAINLTMTGNKVYGFGVNPNGNTGSALYSDEGSYAGNIMTVTNTINTIDSSAKTIASANGLVAFANSVNAGAQKKGETIVLTADIDLGGMEWTPIAYFNEEAFLGTFDGQGHTIKNFKVSNFTYNNPNDGVGLFGWIGCGTDQAHVKNLTVENASIKGEHYAGVIVGYVQSGSIENCHVKNSTVTDVHTGTIIPGYAADTALCGDKAGGIVGYVNNGDVKDCSVKDSTITAGRDAGQVIGCAKAASNVNNTAVNVTVSVDNNCDRHGENVRNEIIGRLN